MQGVIHMAGAWARAAVLALVAATPAVSAEFTPVPGKEFRETLNARIAVSGESVVGVTLPPATDRAGWQGLWVKAPARLRERPLRLAVEIASVDAVYRGTVELQGSLDIAQWLRLPVTPTSQNVAPFLNGEVLAVSVRDLDSGAFLVASWADPGTPGDDPRIRLHVNSQRGDIFLLGERCTRIRWDRLTRFDAVCDLPASRIPENGVLTLLRRDGFARSTQDITLLY